MDKQERIRLLMEKSRIRYIEELNKKLSDISKVYFEFVCAMNEEGMFELKRFFHSLKGTAATLNYEVLSAIGSTYQKVCEGYGKYHHIKTTSEIAKGIGFAYREFQNIKSTFEQKKIADEDEQNEKFLDRKKVLLATKNNFIKKRIDKVLIHTSFEIVTTKTFAEILSFLQEGTIDILILDVIGIDKNGFIVCEYIKRYDENFPIVFITDQSLLVDVFDLFNYDYLVDSYSPERMNFILQSILSKEEEHEGSILIIDDDTTILNLLEEAFKGEGYNVVVLDNPEYVLNSLRTKKTDLILLDVIMLQKSGFEVFRQIRNENISVPIIFMTGMEVIQDSLDGSAFEYVKKPFEIEQLILKSKEVIKKSRHLTGEKIEPYSIKAPNDRNLVKKDLKNGISVADKKIKIIVVDDEPILADLISNGLDEQFYQVEGVYDGYDGLAKIRKTRPDVVIVDLMLPKIDGFEICRNIKSDEVLKSIKVIILSSKRKEDNIIRCFEIGADDYVLKPFNLNELEVRIKRLINK